MSLLGRDVVLVWPEVEATDGDGNPIRKPAAAPVRVRGIVQPVSAEEAEALGQVVTTIYRLTARTLPAGAFARVEWAGRAWDVVGEPQRHVGASPATRNDSVLLRARSPEPAGGP